MIFQRVMFFDQLLLLAFPTLGSEIDEESVQIAPILFSTKAEKL
jgi:hypothetical protein